MISNIRTDRLPQCTCSIILHMVRQIPYLPHKYKEHCSVQACQLYFHNKPQWKFQPRMQCFSFYHLHFEFPDFSPNLTPSINLPSLYICPRVGTYHRSSLFYSYRLHPRYQTSCRGSLFRFSASGNYFSQLDHS